MPATNQSSIIAKVILNVAGLLMINIAVYHFLGLYGILGLTGVIVRYESVRDK